MLSFLKVNENELSFHSGDVLVVLDMADDEWWLGCLKADETKAGYFPAAFVRLGDEGPGPSNSSGGNPFMSMMPYS